MKIIITGQHFKKLIESEIDSNRPTITFLIGPPAAGKSTWVEKNGKDSMIISRDDIVDRLRQGTGMSYGDTFKNKKFQDAVNLELNNHIDNCLKSNKNIIVDMTNMSKRSRSFILSKVPEQYIKNAVVFFIHRDELIRRLKKRQKETGKEIGIDVLNKMINSFEIPTEDEFDNIEIVK